MDVLKEARAYIEAAHLSCDEIKQETLKTWAEEILLPLVKDNIPEALWLKACLYEQDSLESTEEFEKRYLAQVKRAADHGNAEAMFILASRLYDKGKTQEANVYFEKAAHLGHAYAMWCLGLDYLSDSQKNECVEKGLELIRQSADLKFEGAIQFMSEVYALGTYGFEKNINKAAYWKRKLADKDVQWF